MREMQGELAVENGTGGLRVSVVIPLSGAACVLTEAAELV